VAYRKTRLALLPILAVSFVALVCLVILGLSAWREFEARQSIYKRAEVELANMARSLTQHAEDTFELAEALITGTASRLEAEGTGAASIVRAQAILDMRKPTLGRIRGLFVYDEDGNWLATTEKGDFSKFNNSDRDYFQYHRANPSLAPLIGAPVKSKSSGQWVVTISRRFNHTDGSFAGVVLATIDTAYFLDFYRQFDLGSNGSIVILNADNIILARSPEDGQVGRNVSNSPLFVRGSPSGSVHFVSTLDGRERIGFFQVDNRYGFRVAVTRTVADVLAPWRQQVVLRLIVVLALALLIAMLGLYLIREVFKGRRMALALAATEADFRTLAEESSDMVTRIAFDGTLRYVSPSARRIVGWHAEQLVGTPALAGADPEDLPRLEAIVADLRSGARDEARIVYRTRHRDRGEIWVESTMRVTHSTSGDVNGVVAVTRDMTEHKDLEEKLEALAIRDGLTGLANRRRFDDELQKEWARARRDGSTLGLLMIDVDHFKAFNDRYGHQAGDGCLQALGQILAAAPRRPGDLAARYGGEEFAVLLPNTDAAGCRQTGERIRAMLAEACVPHADNPAARVTVSIGAAIADIRLTKAAPPAALVRLADGALYAAKNNGRNRLVISGNLRAVDNVAVA